LTINIDTLAFIWYTKRIHVLYGKGQKLLIAYVIIISLVKLLKIEISFRFYSVARMYLHNINGRDVQRKNVVNNVDKSSLWAP